MTVPTPPNASLVDVVRSLGLFWILRSDGDEAKLEGKVAQSTKGYHM
jgi:hypothetical protein